MKHPWNSARNSEYVRTAIHHYHAGKRWAKLFKRFPITRDEELALIAQAVKRKRVKKIPPAYAAPVIHALFCRNRQRTRVA